MSQLAVFPLATLTPSEMTVLLIEPKRTHDLHYRLRVGSIDEDGVLRDTLGWPIRPDEFRPLAWSRLPFSDTAVAAAVAAGEAISSPWQQMLEGDPHDHLFATRQIAMELSEAIGPRRALLKLHSRLGNDYDGPRLPAGTPRSLVAARAILTDWSRCRTGDQRAIERIAEVLR